MMDRKRFTYDVNVSDDVGGTTAKTEVSTYWSRDSAYGRADREGFDEGVGAAAVAEHNLQEIRQAEANGRVPSILRAVSVELAEQVAA